LAATGLEDLLRELLSRVQGVLDEQARWQLLLDAVVTMSADLSLERLLNRIVELASGLVGARYVAIGVLGPQPGKRLRTFVTHGVTPEERRAIGPLPEGHGILGLIIDQPEPLRLHNLAEHPASFGFPPNHPPMTSFLGVPIRTREHVFGNLYLTEKIGYDDFTEEDERIAVALAAAAGVAIENARLAEQAAHREDWLAATAEISATLAGSTTTQGDALQLVADRARDIAAADVTWIVAGTDPDNLQLRAVSGVAADPSKMITISLEHSLASDVVRSGKPVSVEDMASEPRALDLSAMLDWPKLGPAIVVPLRSDGEIEGVLALAWTPAHAAAFYDVDPTMPASFAEQATLALQVSEAREDQQRLALFEDRDRIGRDLHDVVIQRLFAIGLGLQSAARLAIRPEVTERIEAAVDDIDATIKDIRQTIFALGSMGEAADFQTEVSRLVERAGGTLKFRPSLAFEGPVRTRIDSVVAPDLLAVLAEALSNAARHAESTAVAVVLKAGDNITLTVTDNGRGMPSEVAESGLANMRERAERLGGYCHVGAAEPRGTTIEWSVPANGRDVGPHAPGSIGTDNSASWD
jgi:signal transduction histidine kinase